MEICCDKRLSILAIILFMPVTSTDLQHISIFSQLNAEQLACLQPHAQIKRYARGEVILHEGDRLPARLFAVLKGSIQIKKIAATGKETILRSLPEGEMFAAPALFGDGIAPAIVMAEQSCDILTVERAALLALIQTTPEVAFQIIAVLNERIQLLHHRMHGLISERAIVRLARLIQVSVMEQGVEQTDAGMQLRSHLPYYDIARSIGITYEECVRLFKQLQPMVRYRRGGKIVLTDLAKLEDLIQNPPG
jgi:CRP/FNR family transcriptional regulator, cyclic AMP receptor protein